MESERVRDIVEGSLEHLSLPGNRRFAEALAEYALAVCVANRATNLTGAKDAQSFARGPLFDAMTLLPVLSDDGPLVDIGSGAGLPGVPAALWKPGLDVVLVEPRPLRAAFLDRIRAELFPQVAVACAKDASIADGAYGAAVSQAVWPVTEWAPRGARLVRRGGAVYALASSPIRDDDLPQGLVAEARYETTRPSDTAPRFALRLRRR